MYRNGYPSWNGTVLAECGTSEYVGSLLAVGDLSHIEDDGAPVQAAGPPYTGAQVTDSVESFLDRAVESDAHWAYLLSAAGWLCAYTRFLRPTSFRPLSEVMEETTQ